MGLLNESQMHHFWLLRQRVGDNCFISSAWSGFIVQRKVLLTGIIKDALVSRVAKSPIGCPLLFEWRVLGRRAITKVKCCGGRKRGAEPVEETGLSSSKLWMWTLWCRQLSGGGARDRSELAAPHLLDVRDEVFHLLLKLTDSVLLLTSNGIKTQTLHDW